MKSELMYVRYTWHIISCLELNYHSPFKDKTLILLALSNVLTLTALEEAIRKKGYPSKISQK